MVDRQLGTPMPRPMVAADAQMLWASTALPNDQFLVFAFDGAVGEVDAARAELRVRAQRCPELGLRVVDDHRWRYPRWERREVGEEQLVVYPGTWDWPACLEQVAATPQLDSSQMAWRAIIFPEVFGPPGADAGSVVVVQICHALGDGTRAADLAGALLGRGRGPLPIGRPDRGFLPWRAVCATRAHRRLLRDVTAGVIGPATPARPALITNAGPRGSAAVRTVVVDRESLTGATVTVLALAIIADALGGYLTARGVDTAGLAAEVPMAFGGMAPARAHNAFRNVTVELHPELGREQRIIRIADQLRAHRHRTDHAATRTANAAFASVPAVLLRWGMSRVDPSVWSATVSGHTVVSSVNRGPADLDFGGHPVLFTAGYPALSPMMALTHGVHGIGDRVAFSVHADPVVIEVDEYLDRLVGAIGCPPSADTGTPR